VKPKNKKISFKKNNENSANVYLTQTLIPIGLTLPVLFFIIAVIIGNLLENLGGYRIGKGNDYCS
jgi:hypothetical protein